MSHESSFAVLFAIVLACSNNNDGCDWSFARAQRIAGNAKLHPALRAPGMDMRAGYFLVMDIPWGVAP